MNLVMAMQCGVPCVATGMGAQGEVIGQFGVAVEPGSPAAFIRGITRIMQLPADKRVFMAQGARKHALTHFVPVRSMQKYLQLYFDIVGRQALAAEAVPVQEVDASIPAPPPDVQIVAAVKSKSKTVDLVSSTELADPDSIESRVEASKVAYKKYKPDPEPAPVVEAPPPPPREGDVLEIFESDLANEKSSGNAAMNERARGVADEMEDLLTPEELQTNPSQAAVEPQKTPEKPAAAETATAPEAVKVTEPAKPAEIIKAEEPAKVEEPAKPVEPVVAAASPAVTSMPAIDFIIEPQDSPQVSLPFDTPPATEAPLASDSSIQLELLADPPPKELKRAVGGE
jgi:hypothetical protein